MTRIVRPLSGRVVHGYSGSLNCPLPAGSYHPDDRTVANLHVVEDNVVAKSPVAPTPDGDGILENGNLQISDFCPSAHRALRQVHALHVLSEEARTRGCECKKLRLAAGSPSAWTR